MLNYYETQSLKERWNENSEPWDKYWGDSVMADKLVKRRVATRIPLVREEIFKGVFDILTDFLFLHEVKENGEIGILKDMNAAAVKALGLSKEEIVGQKREVLTITSKIDIADADSQKALSEKFLIIEGFALPKEGAPIPVEVKAQYVLFRGQKFLLSIARDITERLESEAKRKQAEKELQEAKEKAEAASQAKSELIANISHEVRTSINGIIGMISMTLLSPLNSQQQESLKIALDCAYALLRILNDVLDLSKIEAGKFEIVNIEFNLREVLEAVIKTYAQEAQLKGLELSCSVSSDVPDHFLGDPYRLRQVLNNLINNAIKFTEQGGVSLSVISFNQDEEYTDLHFSIKDTGIGIEEKDQAKLFEAFSQIEGSITYKYGGSGLGLAISKKLIELMGGRIWVESKKGQGSTFGFVLRLKTLKAPLNSTPVIVCEKLPEQSPQAYRILLAEDLRINAMVLAEMLERLGFVVDVAQDGEKALALYQEKAYDAILMDIQLPGLDGIEVTKRIRRLEDSKKHTPIIALTAFTLKGDRENFLELGMDDYIAKPVLMEELARTIYQAITQSKLNKQIP